MALLQVTVSESNLASVASIWVGSSGIHLEERYPAVVKVLKVSTVLMVISRSDEGVEVEVSCRAARRQDCQSKMFGKDFAVLVTGQCLLIKAQIVSIREH
jgi:hypothetical protein